LLTNIHPFLPYEEQDLHINLKKNNETSILDSDDKILLGFGVNQGISFILGGLGNILTLAAIPYVRQKYGSQFSILQQNSVVLILQLSLADLLCSLLAIPIGFGYYLLQEGWIDVRTCFSVGLIRQIGY